MQYTINANANANAPAIEKKTLVFGRDVRELSKDELLQAIVNVKQVIKDLNDTGVVSTWVLDSIAKHEATVAELITLLDA